MSRIAYPFLTLGPDAIDSTVWEILREDGKNLPLQKHLEDWDYLRPIHLRKSIKVNPSIAAMHLGIPETDLDLRLLFRIGTGPGTMPRAWVSSSLVEPDAPGIRFEINELVEGSQLSTRMKLETQLLFFGSASGASTLAPSLQAAKVWSHEFDVLLEGSEPRFPMETVSFEKAFPGRPHAASMWYLHWSPSGIRNDFAGSVRLYLNLDHENFMERFTDGDRLLLQAIMADVMTQLISRVVAMDDAQQIVEQAEEGSVANYIGHWLSLAFPGESVADVGSKLERRPGDFHAGILAAAEVGGV